jgi:hypothetical protein
MISEASGGGALEVEVEGSVQKSGGIPAKGN